MGGFAPLRLSDDTVVVCKAGSTARPATPLNGGHGIEEESTDKETPADVADGTDTPASNPVRLLRLEEISGR